MTSRISAVEGLEPTGFWAWFEDLTRIARPSGGEGPLIEHLRRWAADRGLETAQDEAGNLVVYLPATPGRESAPVVILQGHLDMVCERDPGRPNDAAEGRISLVRDGGWLKADGTTLGADDGVAIAAMLALAEEDTVAHGPLELLMTVSEEVGLDGANGLDGSLLQGRIMLNLDSEEDGHLTVGSAGSTDTWVRISRPREPVEPGAATFAIAVSGGLGGHSGMEIALGRANAIKALGRVLRVAYGAAPFRLVSFGGGRSRNAIPRDAQALCSVPARGEDAFREAVASAAGLLRDAYAATDPGLAVSVAPAEAAADAWTEVSTAVLLDAIAVVPTGPMALSAGFDGLVETSSSLGEASTDDDELTLHSLSRSSNDAALPEVIASLEAIAQLAGGRLEVVPNYGGWQPNLDSPLLAVSLRVYERLFGQEPVVTAVHAGLEVAVIASKLPGLDAISFGPDVEGAHSPDERLRIETVERFWLLLGGILDELSR